jgi:hypothetical protein
MYLITHTLSLCLVSSPPCPVAYPAIGRAGSLSFGRVGWERKNKDLPWRGSRKNKPQWQEIKVLAWSDMTSLRILWLTGPWVPGAQEGGRRGGERV